MGAVHRRNGSGWDGVAAKPYDQPGLEGVIKHELVSSQDGAPNYTIRYFEVAAGGHTAREQHPHDHGVMIMRGRARVTLGEDVHELSEGDVVYVAGDELHCFEALDDQPLAFLCVIPPLPAST